MSSEQKPLSLARASLTSLDYPVDKGVPNKRRVASRRLRNR